MPEAQTFALASFALVAAIGLVVAYLRCAGTTLQAPIAWGIASAIVLVVTEACFHGEPSLSADAAQYLAAISTLCPSMALLGAKRPQDRGWQFIVATLWLVLALPVVQSWVFSPQSQFVLHPAWRGFLIVLVLIEVSNYLVTRFGVAMLCFAAGQLLLLGPSTPALGWLPSAIKPNDAPTAGLVMISLSIVLAYRPRRSSLPDGWNLVWHDFRNAFGAVWALRVMERLNDAARTEGRGSLLTWHGFLNARDPLRGTLPDKLDAEESSHAATSDTTASAEADPLETSVRMLLRRFVSQEWIDQRLARQT